MKCIEDEIPFEVPEGWAWCRVRNIALAKGGKRLPKGTTFSEEITAHAYIRVTDMKNNTVLLDSLKYISDETFLAISNYTISSKDLYVTIAGTIGSVGEIPECLDEMNLTENALKLTNISINRSYLCYVLQSDFVQNQFGNRTHQVAMPKLALERVLGTLIPSHYKPHPKFHFTHYTHHSNSLHHRNHQNRHSYHHKSLPHSSNH